jgi:hypothetical protein
MEGPGRSMRDSKTQERGAIEAVAGLFSATWEEGSDPARAFIRLAGKRVAVEVRSVKRRGARGSSAPKPHLRFDRVATGLIERIRATLGDVVPAGVTVWVTITAPIRLPSKTAAFLEERARALLGRGSRTRAEKATIHGNRVQIRVLRNESGRAPGVIGFVHNPESDPLRLLNMTRDMLELLDAERGRRARQAAGDRWLVVTTPEGSSCLEAYRSIHSQMPLATDFTKVFMVFGDGRVGMLAG